MLPSITYLGHRISADGLRPSEDKTAAIRSSPVPLNVSQLRSYLGAVNYYRKFVPNVSSILALLYHLLQQDVKWPILSRVRDSVERLGWEILLIPNCNLIIEKGWERESVQR